MHGEDKDIRRIIGPWRVAVDEFTQRKGGLIEFIAATVDATSDLVEARSIKGEYYFLRAALQMARGVAQDKGHTDLSSPEAILQMEKTLLYEENGECEFANVLLGRVNFILECATASEIIRTFELQKINESICTTVWNRRKALYPASKGPA